MSTLLAPFRMAADMAEQPAILRRFVARRAGLHVQIGRVAPREMTGIAFVGRGSSANAATVGKVMVELATGRPAIMVSPSLDRLYDAHTDYRRWLAVGLSLSGRTPEVATTLRDLHDRGAVTVAITDDGDSVLADAADLTIWLGTGPEGAVPTTKGFTTQLATLVVLAEALGDCALPLEAWTAVADCTQKVLDDFATAERAARALESVQHVSVVGAGAYVGIADEVALKFEEASLVAASAHSSASYRHGPIAMAGAGHPLVAVVGPGRAGAETSALAADVAARGAPVTVIGDGGTLPLPCRLPEWLAAIPTVIRGQQLALALAAARGLDPDEPPRLSKVTLT
ncbi:MAG TPA: SIS domain-containing protein [Mycobacteriales bacterium]|nr:SIS domain-containing protein [Mycobacteriales bacterium]